MIFFKKLHLLFFCILFGKKMEITSPGFNHITLSRISNPHKDSPQLGNLGFLFGKIAPICTYLNYKLKHAIKTL